MSQSQEVKKDEKWYHSFTNILALFVCSVCFTYLFWISYLTAKGRVTNDIAEIKMSVIALLTMVVAYFFGAAHQTKRNEQLLNNRPPDVNVSNIEQVNLAEEGKDNPRNPVGFNTP